MCSKSRTTIHVTTIPNHEAVIYFGGETRGQPICNCYPQLFVEIKNFCKYVMVTFATYERELGQPRPTYKNKNETYRIRTFYYDLYNAEPVRSTDWAVKEKLLIEKCKKL